MGIPDEQAMNKRNMGVPYAIVCNKLDANTIIQRAALEGIKAQIIGKICKKSKHPQNTIQWVGLWKSNMNF